MTINRVIEIIEEHGFDVQPVKENERLVGLDITGYTEKLNIGVSHSVYGGDGDDVIGGLVEHLLETSRYFSPDEATLNFFDEDNNMGNSVREVLEDFEAYEKRLGALVVALKELVDEFNSKPLYPISQKESKAEKER